MSYFDPQFYTEIYPDIPRDHRSAAEHYIRHGCQEERITCIEMFYTYWPTFDWKYYTTRYQDLEPDEHRAVIHYLLYGRYEGRQINPTMQIRVLNNEVHESSGQIDTLPAQKLLEFDIPIIPHAPGISCADSWGDLDKYPVDRKVDGIKKKIPKIIHYAWLGDKQFDTGILKQWKKILGPGWKIIRWDENSIKNDNSIFLQQAMENKKWGICVDYIRAKCLYEQGGVWMDTDVILSKNLSPFLQFDFFAGWECDTWLNVGTVGSVKGLEIFGELLNYYKKVSVQSEQITDKDRFVKEVGTGPMVLTHILRKHLKPKHIKERAVWDACCKEYCIERQDVFTVKDDSTTNYAIHTFDASWISNKPKQLEHGGWYDKTLERFIKMKQRFVL